MRRMRNMPSIVRAASASIHFALTVLLIGHEMGAIATTAADYAYGYDAEEFTLAFVNVTALDTNTGQLLDNKREVGKFGHGRVSSVTGVLVDMSAINDACESVDPLYWPREPWIAFLRYGVCDDARQLKNIAATNASAAIIYGSKPISRLGKLYTKSECALRRAISCND